MILLLLLIVVLSTSIFSIVLYKRDNLSINMTQLLLVGLIILVFINAFHSHQLIQYDWALLNFNDITLTASIEVDSLSHIMVAFILILGLLIYRYAQNYLESDNTRMRFLSQFNLVLGSVLLLVISANLLTAFIAWQFIGINLYLLLNHYHNDPAANRAAKKKFVINRLGDSSFLVAIVLAYHSNSAASFSTLQSSPHAELIGILLLISVMTKCAQFPFHIWLLDTMETPTPVSALMHAGVINAGGILLTRVSSTIVQFHSLTCFLLLMGLLSAILSIFWMNQQPDLKKKLAYSTMGQMGYMLVQCSLGAFPAAVFHLISHGFYKASLFLNAGETLNQQRQERRQPIQLIAIINALLIASMIFFFCLYCVKSRETHIPVLMYGFMFLTIFTFSVNVETISKSNRWIKSSHYLLITVLFSSYLYCYQVFHSTLSQYEYTKTIPFSVQISIFIILFFLQICYFLNKNNLNVYQLKDRAELFFRYFCLNPLRMAGNIVNDRFYKKPIFILYLIVLLFTILAFIYGIFDNDQLIKANTNFTQGAILLFLTIGTLALIIANRCLSIRSLLTYLVLFELAFANIALFDANRDIAIIGVFHIINISTVLFMLYFLIRDNLKERVLVKSTNRFPTRVFYLVFALLLLIGIPGTASFVAEFYLLSALLNSHLLLVLLYIGVIILLSIVVMHSLQLYAFNQRYSMLLSKSISLQEHLIFLSIIALNVSTGIFPAMLLNQISW